MTGVLTPLPCVDAPAQPRLDAPTVATPPASLSMGHPPIAVRSSVVRSVSTSFGGVLARGQTLGSRYQIIRLIGEGGMGCVYEAWDAELGVVVALKVIRPEIASDPQAAADLERRFKRELLLARQVTHKNVVRIHDLGTIDGVKYITMSYVDGANLATLLSRDGKLPVPRALRIARGIVAGLSAAHQAGVVHRDLKPPNIMIDGRDEPLIMDFGVARSAEAPAATTMSGDVLATRLEAASVERLGRVRFEQHTTVGTVIGTIEYMAPEQARGEAVDHRADIYAFGLILYDMLAGHRRNSYTGGSIAELADRMGKPPASLRSFDATIPPSLEAIITRCLAPDAAARYQTTSELVAALDRLDANGNLLPVSRRFTTVQLAAAGVLVLSLIGGTWWMGWDPAPVMEPDPVSILIADFENRTNDPVFEGSLEQALGIAIEGASFVTAYPRQDAMRVASQSGMGDRLSESVAQLISRREGIKYVLAGGIEPASSGYRITIRALDPALDPRESEPVARVSANARTKAEVLATVGSLAANIRGVLGDTMPESARLAAAETYTAISLDAVRAFVRGQELNRSGKPREALESLEEAVRLDSNFGAAYLHMASIYTNIKLHDQAKENYDTALTHVNRMTEREKYRTLGLYYLSVARNYVEAVKTYETLVQRYPADNVGYANLALAYLYTRNVERAVAMGKKATEIYPKNILQRTNYATYLMYSGNFDAAASEAQRVLKENPSYEWANLTLALSTLARGDENAARQAYNDLWRVNALGQSLANLGLADLEMYFGRYEGALRALAVGIEADEKEKLTTNSALKLVATAEARLALGQASAAAVAATRAAALEQHESVLFPAARVLIAVGRADKAQSIAESMTTAIQSQKRSYGSLLLGAIALHKKRYPEAIDLINAGMKLHDSWMAHALLAEAYTAAGHFAEALREWEACLNRRGEATDAFFADTSTLRYLPPVHYWLGRVQEQVGAAPAARASYESFLKLRTATPSDPLAIDAARRLASGAGL